MLTILALGHGIEKLSPLDIKWGLILLPVLIEHLHLTNAWLGVNL